MLKKGLLPLVISILTLSTAAQAQLYHGADLSPATPEEIADQVTPGSILFLGENHGLAAHRDQHVQILNLLRKKGLKVSVGLEFINYTDQDQIDLYRSNQITEAQFLKNIKWGSISFDFYKQQLNFPDLNEGAYSLGLNIPREVTSQISKNGLLSLTPEQQALMPPNFAFGRDSYKTRFMAVAGEHCPNPENCFAAQCTWDDTMAWRAAEFIKNHPDQVLAIVVGEFHVQYGGGIPYRLQQRLPGVRIVTLSQIWAEGMTDEDVRSELQPSPIEGPRADFIWVSGR